MSNEPNGELLIYVGTNQDLLGESKVWSKIDPETLRANINTFVAALGGVVPEVESQPTGFQLAEFEVSLTVGAKGEVGFLGTGAEASGEASLKLRFSRG